MMPEYEFRILIIDSNSEVQQDFIKILSPPQTYPTSVDILNQNLFGDQGQTDPRLPVFQINTASQGQEGVENIERALQIGKPYAVAFVDVQMPLGINGIETIKRIWEIDPNIQTVMCTSFSDYSWEETIAELGISENLLILKKPFDSATVRQLASALSKKWKGMQETRRNIDFLSACLREEQENFNERLEFNATHDSLTQLPNRILLTDRINTAIHRMKRRNKLLALFFFDVDRFKLINDGLGHTAGDELLTAVAKRLESVMRQEDTVSRSGSDEFIVLVSDLENVKQVERLALKYLQLFEDPFNIVGREVTVTASIGISIFPTDGESADPLIKAADLAMYRAKELGVNQFNFYTEDLNKESLARLEKMTDLRQALHKKEFFLDYQPQIDSNTGKIISVEALIRWKHATKGIIPPKEFIPLAEESGLILPIGEWVLRTACQQNKAWQNAGLPPIRVAVNIASGQLKQRNFVELVRSILEEADLAPEFLEIEMTENIIIGNPDIIQTVNGLKSLGLQIVLDDFGTGNSSLNYLKKIHIDSLKIDQSFVQNIHLNQSDEVIIQAIMSMAKSLNFEVVAEGVESTEQLSFLIEQHCHEIQGFLYSHPISPDECVKLLKKINLGPKTN